MPDLTIVSAWEDDWLVVHVTGELSMENVSTLSESLDRLSGRRVRLDLDGISFDGDAVTGALIACRREFERQGRVLAIAGPDAERFATEADRRSRWLP